MPTVAEINFNQEVKDVMRRMPGGNSGKQFARSVLQYAYGLSREDAIDANACDGRNDRGLDAYFTDDDHFYLFQFKYHEQPFGTTIVASASGAGNQLVHCWPIVSNLETAAEERRQLRIREELYDAAVDYKSEVVESGKRVVLVVVEWADGDPAAARGSMEAWIAGNVGTPIQSFQVVNFAGVRQMWETQKAPAKRYNGSKTIRYLIDEGKTEIPEHKAIVVDVPGSELVSLFRDIKEVLFDPNVRFGVGETRYNLRIGETARSNPEKFWYFNNGITMVCDSYSESDGVITLNRPGVVNGGQTIRQIEKIGEIPASLKVLVRIIASDNDPFTQDIALYTNSQNPIAPRDLKSNTAEQKTYGTEFSEIPVPWFYERKKGSWNVLPEGERSRFEIPPREGRKETHKRLPNELVGKATLSFSLEEPVIARTKRDAVWLDSPKGYYGKVFKQERDVYEMAVAALVQKIIDREQGTASLVAGGSSEDLKYAIQHLTALVGRMIREKYPEPRRDDYRRIYEALVDSSTSDISENNFIVTIFRTILLPFLTWYATMLNEIMRVSGQTWEAVNWYKGDKSWKGDSEADQKSMKNAFRTFASFTPAAGNVRSLIP